MPPIFISIVTFVAQEQGFFKQYGADVELRQFDNGTAAARAEGAVRSHPAGAVAHRHAADRAGEQVGQSDDGLLHRPDALHHIRALAHELAQFLVRRLHHFLYVRIRTAGEISVPPAVANAMPNLHDPPSGAELPACRPQLGTPAQAALRLRFLYALALKLVPLKIASPLDWRFACSRALVA